LSLPKPSRILISKKLDLKKLFEFKIKSNPEPKDEDDKANKHTVPKLERIIF
jgi:hypothetical protein